VCFTTGQGLGDQRTKESPGKEDEDRGFAWGKGMLSSGLRLPLLETA